MANTALNLGESLKNLSLFSAPPSVLNCFSEGDDTHNQSYKCDIQIPYTLEWADV
jgi:hypothetical protein